MPLTKQDKEEILDILVGAIQSILFPILEDQTNKLNNLTVQLNNLQKTVDSHTVSLKEIYYEIMGVKLKLNDHQTRIEHLENQAAV